MASGWHVGAAFGSAVLWILLKAQMLSVEALGEEIPARQEMGTRAHDSSRSPRGEKETRRTINMRDEGLP